MERTVRAAIMGAEPKLWSQGKPCVDKSEPSLTFGKQI
jgi:hypothetical protein